MDYLVLTMAVISTLASGYAVYMSYKSINNDKITKEIVDQMSAALKKRYIF